MILIVRILVRMKGPIDGEMLSFDNIKANLLKYRRQGIYSPCNHMILSRSRWCTTRTYIQLIARGRFVAIRNSNAENTPWFEYSIRYSSNFLNLRRSKVFQNMFRENNVKTTMPVLVLGGLHKAYPTVDLKQIKLCSVRAHGSLWNDVIADFFFVSPHGNLRDVVGHHELTCCHFLSRRNILCKLRFQERFGIAVAFGGVGTIKIET
mmetsp:Transcript_66667/g.126996  ORF Transcript_66667/g.126996 Transcript_66667/m.126996 type:complete len:207 (-) Transcript_66667:126-746(-)